MTYIVRKRKYTRKPKRAIVTSTGRRQVRGLFRSMAPRFRNLVHSFKRSCLSTRIKTSTAGLSMLGYSFKLNQLPNYSDFTSLYDYYRLNMVNVKFISRGPSTGVVESYNNGSIGVPILWYAIDKDDDSAPADTNELREYGNHKMHIFTSERRVCNINIRPRVLAEVYKSAIATSYGVGKKTWLDMADSGATPHYGLKVAIEVPTDNNTQVQNQQCFDVEFTYYFQMKNPR